MLIGILAAAILAAGCTSSDDSSGRSGRSSSSAATAASDPGTRDGAEGTDSDGSGDAGYEPELVASTCSDPTTDTTRIDCYRLTLPENRSEPTGRQVELPVIRVRAPGTKAGLPAAGATTGTTGTAAAALTAATGQPPVVYLHGGPGDGAVDGWVAWEQLMDGVPRDFIAYDQRGGGHANPRLDCPEHSEALATTLARHPAWKAARQTIGESIKACNTRLRDSGVDLAQYDTYNSVLDLEDLRKSLGAEKLSLIGVSYGTRLAMAYESSYPQRVASLALGGVVAPGSGGPEDERKMLDPALSRLFKSCSGDTDCSSRFPSLRAELESAAKTLDDLPVTVGPATQIKVTGDELHAGVFGALYDSSTIPLLPMTISRIASGDPQVWSVIGPQIAPLVAGGGAFGAQISINCADLAARSSSGTGGGDSSRADRPSGASGGASTDRGDISGAEKENRRVARSDPGRARDLVLSSTDSFCEFWPVADTLHRRTDPLERAGEADPPPTLVVSGELDPITPVDDARRTASDLKGRYLEVPRGGHDAMLTSPCARSALRTFLVDPSSTVNSRGDDATQICPADGAQPFA